MFVVIVDFAIRPEHTERFMHEMIVNANTSRNSEPGCHQFDVCIDPKDPTQVFLYELYADRAAFDAHLQAPHFQTFDQKTAPWIERKSARLLHRTYP